MWIRKHWPKHDEICSTLEEPLHLVLSHVSQVFVGNTDNDSTKTNLFDPPIIAQYIRIVPVVCRKACTLRMELVGCELNGKLTQLPSFLFIYFSQKRKRKLVKNLCGNEDFLICLKWVSIFSVIIFSPQLTFQGREGSWDDRSFVVFIHKQFDLLWIN